MSLLAGLLAATAIALSGVVRGFSGFGFGLVAVPMLSLILDPRQAVGIAMILQATSGVLVLWHSWRAVAWSLMGSLCIGTAGTLWLGLLVLDRAPADTIRLYLAVIVIVAAGLIALGLHRGAPLSSGGSRWVRFPAFTGTMRALRLPDRVPPAPL